MAVKLLRNVNIPRKFNLTRPSKEGMQFGFLCLRFRSDDSQDNGVIYDKKPVKVYLEDGKTYFWCACGRSSKQPFCDGTHKKPELNIKQLPIKFEVKDSREYWLCLCKQSSNKPFCDASHKSATIQNSVSIVDQKKRKK